MTMRFAYKQGHSASPVVVLQGRMGRPRPLINLTLISATATRVVTALLDPGADDTVFERREAVRLGIDLASAPTRTLAGVTGPAVVVAYVQITIRVTDGVEFREWLGWVGFTTAQLTHPTLGFAGFLQYFDANFKGHAEEAELTINPSYSGK
jgi:hypothetical protein